MDPMRDARDDWETTCTTTANKLENLIESIYTIYAETKTIYTSCLCTDCIVSRSNSGNKITTMDSFFLVIFAIGFLILCKFASFMYVDYITRKKFSHIPGLASYPIIGTLQLFLKTEKDRIEWFLSLLNTFKDGVFLLWIGRRPLIFIFKPELLQTILSSTAYIEKGTEYDFFKVWLGNGLVTVSGKQWFKNRKLFVPTFHFNILEKFAVIMSKKTEIMIKRLEKEITENPAKATNIIPFIYDLTLDIICESAMGINMSTQESKSAYSKTVQRFLDLVVARINRPWFWVDWVFHLSPIGKKSRILIRDLHEFTNEIIRKKKFERLSQNGRTKNEEYDPDTLDKPKEKAFLELLLNLNENGSISLTDEELRSHVDTFVFAGQDTTATSISWALFCLGNNLKHQEKVHKEIEEVFKGSQSPATIKEILQLKYLERVIKEVRRLYPSIPLITRKLPQNTKIGNYIIPKDATIIIPILMIHRNPEIWSDPLKFDPDRFLSKNMKYMHPYAYIPFSAGPRNCIGQKYAQFEEKIVLTAILRKWRVKSVETPADVVLNDNLVLRPNNKIIHLHFSPKN